MNKKRLISFLAAAAMLALTACGDSEDSSKSKSKKDKADSSSVVESESSSSSTDEGTTDAVTDSSSETMTEESQNDTSVSGVSAFEKELGMKELEEIVNNLKATDYEGGKSYLESAFKNFLFEPDSGSALFDELLENNTLSNYPTSEKDSYITQQKYFSIPFHYTENNDTVPLLFGRELSSIGYGESANGLSFSYSFGQYSKANGNTGNFYGKTYKYEFSPSKPEMTNIFASTLEGDDYDGIRAMEKISADNYYEIVTALIDIYGEPKATNSGIYYEPEVYSWNEGDTITKDSLKAITSNATDLSCCWENTPIGKISDTGFFGNDSALVILSIEW